MTNINKPKSGNGVATDFASSIAALLDAVSQDTGPVPVEAADGLHEAANTNSDAMAAALLSQDVNVTAGTSMLPQHIHMNVTVVPSSEADDQTVLRVILPESGRYRLMVANGYGELTTDYDTDEIMFLTFSACGDREAHDLVDVLVELGEKLKPLAVARLHHNSRR